MPVVMLKREWPGQFRRVIRDDNGAPVEPRRVLLFTPGESVEVDDCDMPAIADDVKAGTLKVNANLKTRKAEEPVAAPEPPAAEPKPEPIYRHGHKQRR